MTDYLAAREGDPLIHSSALADFVSGLVEGAVIIGILAAASSGIGTVIAATVLAGLIASGGLEAIGNAAGKIVDNLIGTGPPDAFIVSGSNDVHIMGKKAARAAGTVDRDYLNTSAGGDGIDWAAMGILALTGVAATMSTALNPGVALTALAERISKTTWDDVADWGKGIWDSLSQPLVDSADPHATPAPQDCVDCKKGHAVTSQNFIAQGSKSVMINNQPAARNGDKSTCEAEIQLAENPRVRIGGETITVRDIRSGKNMLAYLAGGLFSGGIGKDALKMLAKLGLGRWLVRVIMKEGVCPIVGAAATEALTQTAAKGLAAGTVPTIARASHTPYPINIATGAKILADEDDLDFVLPDRIPLYWQRVYHSRNLTTGMLGTGWMLPFETRLWRLADDALMFRDMTGRELGMGSVRPGDVIDFREEGMRLFSSPNGAMVIQSADGEYQLYEPDPVFPGEWRLHRIYDRHENVQHFEWNAQGQLVRICGDNEALDVALEYESTFGRLAAVWQICGGERRPLVAYRYNEQGQLIAVTDADGIVTREFGWDLASDMLAWHGYATGLKVHYQWHPAADARHWRAGGYQVRDERDALLESWRIDADEVRRTARVSSDEGAVTEHTWDALGRITRYTDAHGGRWVFEWRGGSEQLDALVQPDGGRWEYTCDDRGNLTLARDPLGRSLLMTWHPLYALPLKEVLPDGAVWQYDYSLAGDVIALTDPEGGVTRFTWDERGDLLQRTDALANTNNFRWDDRGQLVREEDCSGYPTRYRYDDAGRLVSTTDALGNTERYVWSAAGRLRAQVRADGRETRYQYSPAGLLCGQNIDGELERRVVLNARGQVTEAIDPAGQVTRFTFSRAGRLVSLTNGNRQQWHFRYAPDGLLTQQEDYAGRITEYHYNRAQQVETLVRRPEAGSGLAPQVLHYEYDALGRMVARETELNRTEFSYGALATTLRRMPREAWRQAMIDQREPDGVETIVFTRNKLGLLVSEANHGGTYQHRYDALGNLSETAFPDGRALEYLRYGSGHLLEMQLSLGGRRLSLAGYQRDRLHRETQRTLGALTLETQYDMAGRVRHHRCVDDVRQRLVSERRYQWDRADQIVRQMFTDGTPDAPEEKYRQAQWGYDAAGRMTRSLQPESGERFWWDAADNRTTPDLHPVWNNMLKRLDGVEREYDGFGRMTVRRDRHRGVTQRFSYDDEHRISGVQIEGDRDYARAEYRYDALGRRTGKVVWRHGAQAPERTTYAWSGMQMVGERSDRRPDAAVQYVYEENSYAPLARVDSTGDAAEVYWYHAELNGLPERMTDASGETVWRGTFSAWGRTLRESARGGWRGQQNLRFQGQYLDRETGLHYNTLRYYDAWGGCYTQVDPIGLAGGLNTYGYVLDPITWIDPLGLAGCGRVNTKHIFHGEINRRGRAVGFHHEGSIGHQGKARVTQVTTPANSHGVYKGKVEIFDNTSGQWIQKGPESTFFPKSWNRQQVISETREAYSKGTVLPNGKWEGISPSGVKIGGYLDSDGNINTAFPIM
ncbi:TPA: EndoU domain-containing protein [Pluralibacter gergoviae]|uniref:EndoU domain-containing protein n=3 Tax=Pluralibacter gergoviae TaxID=61647 RepID=UPI00069F3BE7|nr:EndoU domain-containing protein [Pluralibacter gergoviae]ELC3076621.1 EndoU domain-containing protein [Pluralibacter gergoviae]MBK4119361.1 EndoU domain-containing protein [Pluralibacter gergoviae]HDS1154205.1 EndoU domain-containing protein [Pluralibacter gergoviae]